jgi:hypothetical protein
MELVLLCLGKRGGVFCGVVSAIDCMTSNGMLIGASIQALGRKRFWSNLLLTFLLFNSTADGFLPGGSGATIRHITQKYAYHTTFKQNAAHKAKRQ